MITTPPPSAIQPSSHPAPPKRGKPKNPKIKRETHRRFRLAHQSVNMKNTARTRLATLLALVSNPHAMSAAPIRPEPRYPAGSVIHGMPPDMLVAPPSSAMTPGRASERSQGQVGVGRKKKRLTVEFDGMDACACEDARKRVAHLQQFFFIHIIYVFCCRGNGDNHTYLVKPDRQQSASQIALVPAIHFSLPPTTENQRMRFFLRT